MELRSSPLALVGRFVHCSERPSHEDSSQGFHAGDAFFHALEDHAIVVDHAGKIAWFGARNDDGFAAAVEETGALVRELPATQFVCPGFVDTHIHAPQYRFTGTAIDKSLMDWLNSYTFPAEAKLKDDLRAAREVYEKVVLRTLSFGTTTALYFATKDLEPCKVLAEVCKEKGQRALIGKVCMDRNAPEYYCETTEEALADSETFINYIRGTQSWKDGLLYPVITPRFIPTCTTELMMGLGQLAKKYDCHIQSHISESLGEVDFSASLHPNEGTDAQIFDRCSLLTDKAVMAHAVHLTAEDLSLMKDRGSAISHCPLSNFYFADGYLPTAKIMRQGLKVGLGTDVAGGYSPSMLNAQRIAVVASLAGALEHRTELQRDHGLNHRRAFYLATLGGAEALGLQNQIGSFEKHKDFDALVMDTGVGNFDTFPAESLEEDFQKICTLGDDRNVIQVYVQGRLVRDQLLPKAANS